MPYLCFSTHYPENHDLPKNFKDYEDLLRHYDNPDIGDSVIHESPTLDEWYYNVVSCSKDKDSDSEAKRDRIRRNEDQVVTRFLEDFKEHKNTQHCTLLRVYQVWVWVIDNSKL